MLKTIKNLFENKLFRIIFISLFIFVSLTITVSIILINNSKPNINIDTTGTKISIPASEMKRVYRKLTSTIEDNSDNFDKNKKYEGVIDQYSEKLSKEKNTATFLVNFDEIKQSYRVNVTWPNAQKMSDISIMCPLSDSKYPNTPCKTEVNNTSEIVSFLPYYETLESGKFINVTYKYNNNNPYIEVQIDSCGDTNLINLAIDRTKNFLKEHNFNPEDYKIFAPNNLCEGGAESGSNQPTPSETFYISGNRLKTKDENVNNFLPYFVPSRYNVYPTTDKNGNIKSIHAEISGCTAYQATPMEERVRAYLLSHNINYNIEFEYCKG